MTNEHQFTLELTLDQCDVVWTALDYHAELLTDEIEFERNDGNMKVLKGLSKERDIVNDIKGKIGVFLDGSPVVWG